MKRFLRFFMLAVVFAGMTSMSVAQEVKAEKVMKGKAPGIFNSLSLGAGVGSTGVDVSLAMPIGRHFAIRGGINFMPGFSFTAGVNADMPEITIPGYTPPQSVNIDLEGDLKRTSGEFLLNYYPFNRSSFFLTAGAYFGGTGLVGISGFSQEVKDAMDAAHAAGITYDPTITIGNNTITIDDNGRVDGGLEVKKFRPYVGLGFGRVVPRRRVGLMFELGCQFHGTPKVVSGDGQVLKTEEFGDDDFSKIVDKLTVYPVMKFRINIRLF